ncbi:MAG: hypothetical protein JO037_12470, partial [Actinobacteria bacterium]|nr:hypothetical protein [Actinomycetota bacterium]
WGQALLGRPGPPELAARAVQDAFGIAAVVLVVLIARLPGPGRRDPGRAR